MKRLSLLLAVCLMIAMLPCVGHTEDDALALQTGEGLLDNDLDLALPTEPEIDDAALIEGLAIDLEGQGLEIPVEETSGADAEGAAAQEEQSSPVARSAEPAGTPHVDPDGPQLAANEITLGIGEMFWLEPVMPDGEAVQITYLSEDSSIAKVSVKGKITGRAVGRVCVTAYAENGTYSECFVTVKKAPEAVSFNVESLHIAKGESYSQLEVYLGEKPEEYAGSYTLQSENTNVVKIRDNRIVEGLKAGRTRVKVTTYNYVVGTVNVTVGKAPEKITASVDKKTLGVGEKGQVSYKLPKDTSSAVTFSSRDPDIVRVDSTTGEIEGVSVGKTRIYATTFNGKKDYVNVSVAPAPTTLEFESDAVTLGVGMKSAVSAAVDDGAAGEIRYSVKKKKIATYSGGALRGVAEGRTVLTAETYNGLKAECQVEVLPAPEQVTLPYESFNIGVKQSVTLHPDVGDAFSTFTYSTSKKSVVSVNEDGKITGIKKGSAVITVRTYNGMRCKLKVSVVGAPGKVSLSPATLDIGVGGTAALTCVFPRNTAAAVSFVSADPDVAEVDDEGVVTGIGAGETEITATTSNGKKATATVYVHPAVTWAEFTEETVAIAVGQTHPLYVTLSPEDSLSDIRYESADEDVATVDEDGVVTGVAKGKTTVTAYTDIEGITAKATVSVLSAPKGVKFKPDAVTLNAGETLALSPVITKGTATSFTYASSDESVAKVSEDGVLTAVSRGKAVVTVTTLNNRKAKLAVTVEDALYPESASLTNAPETMMAGDSLQLAWTVTPAGADPDFRWETSNADIAYVDEAGVLYAVDLGYATITAVSTRNEAIEFSFKVAVETKNATLTLPARITGTAGIPTTLERIDAIRVSAIGQIDALKENGKITSADATKRKRIINNAFGDYSFPWMTLKKQKYWKAENSEGGAKDFKTGKVYYGVPYISGSGSNRAYNVDKLLRENRYYDSGKGYYILNQNNLKSGKYCGNDCSCFVDAAIWGTNSSHSNDRTKEIIKSSAYRTISGYDTMRTGDLICKGGHHVVMFLYYVNAEKDKIMIIENGGIEPGTNTVHCIVMNVDWYTSRGYKVRRLKSLG